MWDVNSHIITLSNLKKNSFSSLELLSCPLERVLSDFKITTWFTRQLRDEFEGVRSKKNTHTHIGPHRSKQKQRLQLQTPHALSANGWTDSGFVRDGLGGAAVSQAQQSNSQNAFVYTHMLNSHSRTANIVTWDVVASLSGYLIICLAEDLQINGQHSKTLKASVDKANLRVFFHPRRPWCFVAAEMALGICCWSCGASLLQNQGRHF